MLAWQGGILAAGVVVLGNPAGTLLGAAVWRPVAVRLGGSLLPARPLRTMSEVLRAE